MEAKVPPNDKGLEIAVLGAMLMDKSIIPIVMNKMFMDAFYNPTHQIIFKAIQNLYEGNKPVDIEMVCFELKRSDQLDKVGGVSFVACITNAVVTTAATETHIAILLECYMKRKAIEISLELIKQAYDIGSDSFDITATANNEFLKVHENVLKGTEKTMEHFVIKVAQNRDAVLKNGSIGISSGFAEIDKVIGGWCAPDMIVIASRPGMGKTALMLSTLHNVSVLNKKPGAVFSLEMSGEQLTERLEAIDSKIFHKKLRYNQLNDLDKKALFQSEKNLATAPIYIEDKPAITIRELRTKAHLLKQKYGIEYVMIDYLQLMKGIDEKYKNREQVISEISRGCKEIAKELEIPVIALSQLSRAVELRADKMPQLSDLRESGSIEQDADEVIFLMRPEYYGFKEPVEIGQRDYETNGLVICTIDKNRHGETKNIALRFEPELMKYSDYEKELFIHKSYDKTNSYRDVDF